MKCFEVTGCSEEMRKTCYVWTSFKSDSPEMENVQCWVIKGVYHPDQKVQLAKCKKCKYFQLMNKESGIIEEIKADSAIIRCEGSLNNDRAKALEKVWATVKQSGKEHVVLDLSNVTNIYSCAIGLIVKIHKEMESRDGILVITGAKEFPLSLFKRLHLDTVLRLEADTHAAMSIFDTRIQKRQELLKIMEEEERVRNAPRKRMPCWEYWNNHNPANATACDQCYRKITENTEPCWIVEGNIEGVTFQFVSEECLGCSYYEEFKNSPCTPAAFTVKKETAQKQDADAVKPVGK